MNKWDRYEADALHCHPSSDATSKKRAIVECCIQYMISVHVPEQLIIPSSFVQRVRLSNFIVENAVCLEILYSL